MANEYSYIGKQIGNYRVVAEIASGSFGRVYRGEHLFLKKRSVAIKLLHTLHLGSLEERENFLREAEFLEELKHPYILPILDVGVDEGCPYLIAEYAANGSLRNRLKQQAPQFLPVHESLTILTQIGQALQYAHEQHIIHRDLKPENILFNVRGDVLLADFGIATMLGTASMKYVSSAGTPRYMAPEQFKGNVSKESDQYALGCIAYELFTGSPPFTAPDFFTVGFLHISEPVIPPKQLNSRIPPQIEQAILKALAKQRTDRFPNILAFLNALQPDVQIEPAISFPTQANTTLVLPILDEQEKSPLRNQSHPGEKTPEHTATDTQGTTRRRPNTEENTLERSQSGWMASLPASNSPKVVENTNVSTFVSPTKKPADFRRRQVMLAFITIIAIASIIGSLLLILPGILASKAHTIVKTPQTVATTALSATTVVTQTPTSALSPTPTLSPTATFSPTATATPTSTVTPSPTPLSPTVVPPLPLNLIASPSSFYANNNCSWDSGGSAAGGAWTCSATLTNKQGTQQNLSWSTSSSGLTVQGVLAAGFSPASGTLSPGQSSTVTITVDYYNHGSCDNSGTSGSLIFSGPINNVSIPWTCSDPHLAVSPNNFTFGANCTPVSGGDQCVATVTIQDQGILRSWSTSSAGVTGITFSPPGGYFVSPSNSIAQVVVFIPLTSCPTSANLIFSGPINTITVPWSC